VTEPAFPHQSAAQPAEPTSAPQDGQPAAPAAPADRTVGTVPSDAAADAAQPPADAAQPPAAEPPAPSQELRSALAAVRTEVGKAVVGQDAAVTSLLIALLCQGHVLLEGVPGVAKTLLVRTLAAALKLDTKRVQFTPDLMPGDVTGSLVYDARTAEFSFREGPVFTNLVLADEINRTPPKTQASLLEAMEERQVSVDGTPRPLPDPFLVIATQNPVEYEGTYSLPEAQLDRFLLKLVLPLPERDQEVEVLARHAAGFDPRDLAAAGVTPVADASVLERARLRRRRVPRHAVLAVALARCLPAWRHRAAAYRAGLGVAVGPLVRDPRRHQGAGAPDAAAPRAAARRGRARGRHRRGRAGHGAGLRARAALRAAWS
jgi:MoxR-like ATPase